MSSNFGGKIKISIFGQSHSEGIGVVIDGLPWGEAIDMEEVQLFLNRRAPGRAEYTTARKESDIPKILSGLADGKTCGAPLCAVFENSDTRSVDYRSFRDIPRPSHADYAAHIKYRGFNDIRGGGHFSGRLTAPLCFAGAVCLQILKSKGISIGAHILSIGSVMDARFDAVGVHKDLLEKLTAKAFPVINDDSADKMLLEIKAAKERCDSVGGVIECCAVGVPAGIGEPMFDGVENKISQAVFGIPAVKGIEFGSGFMAGQMSGSLHNDAFYFDGGSVKTKTNNHGGILGGITSGMPILFKTAIKPTPSIAAEQTSVNLKNKNAEKLLIKGRHDPCIVPRAVPCIEAAAAIALLDLYYKEADIWI